MAPDTPCSNPFVIPADDGLGALLGLHPDPWDPLPISVPPTPGFDVHLLQTQISPRGHAWLWGPPSTETWNSWGLSCPGPTGGGGGEHPAPLQVRTNSKAKSRPQNAAQDYRELGAVPTVTPFLSFSLSFCPNSRFSQCTTS